MINKDKKYNQGAKLVLFWLLSVMAFGIFQYGLIPNIAYADCQVNVSWRNSDGNSFVAGQGNDNQGKTLQVAAGSYKARADFTGCKGYFLSINVFRDFPATVDRDTKPAQETSDSETLFRDVQINAGDSSTFYIEGRVQPGGPQGTVVVSATSAKLTFGLTAPPADPSAGTSGKINITNISLSNLTSSSVTIAWTTDLPSNSDVVYGEQPADNNPDKGFTDYSLKSHSVNLSGLKAGTSYVYQVRSSTSAGGPTETSSVGNFTTKNADNTGGSTGGAPGAPATPATPPPGVGGTITQAPTVPNLYNPIGSNTIIELGFKMMKGFLAGIVGLALVFIVFGGIQLTVSRGNPEGVTKGKDIIIWSLAGVVVALLSFSIIAIMQNLLHAF